MKKKIISQMMTIFATLCCAMIISFIFTGQARADEINDDIVFATVDGIYGCYAVKDGKILEDLHGFAKNEYGWWYCENGRVQFGKTGTYYGEIDGEQAYWYIKEGKFTPVTDIVFGSKGGEGTVVYVRNGRIDEEPTIVKNEYGCWAVFKGVVNFDYNGFRQNEYGWWLCQGGKVQFDKTGAFYGDAFGQTETWYVDGGKINTSINGFAWKNGIKGKQCLAIKNGKAFIVNGFYKNYYCTNGVVQFDANGMIYGTINGITDYFYVVDGEFTKTTDIVFGGDAFDNQCMCIVDGRIDKEAVFALNKYGCWAVDNGIVNFNFNGFRKNKYGYWYCIGGKVQADTSEAVYDELCGEYGYWYIENGKYEKDYDSIAFATVDGVRSCYAINYGRLDFSINGFVKNPYGWWLCKNSKVQFNYTDATWGTVNGKSAYWYVEGGKVQFINDIVFATLSGSKECWACFNGEISTTFEGIASNAYGDWYCKYGKVQFGYTGKWTDPSSGKVYNIKEGKYINDKVRVASPALVTTIGQSDMNVVEQILKKSYVTYTANPQLSAYQVTSNYEVLIMAVGGSNLGLGAAGVDAYQELSRGKALMNKAHQLGMKVICMHLGGRSRRGSTADLMIQPMLEECDYLIVAGDGDSDGMLSYWASDVPVKIVPDTKSVIDIVNSLKY